LNNNQTTKLLIGVAISLFVFSLVSSYAQEGVNVTMTNGTTTEVPTLAEQIETSMQSIIALVASIIAIIGLIIKSGILDSYVSKRKQEQIYNNTQMGFLTTKKILEDKALTRQVISDVVSTMPPEKQTKYQEIIANLDDQINKTNEQLTFYYDKAKNYVPKGSLSKINPDLCRELPRESRNMSQEMAPGTIPKRIGEKNV
jgi:hypothetical protein